MIIPVYNVEAYLEACVDAVLAQTYENLEILLLDDGSTDNSGTICDAYAGKEKRVRTVHKENAGQADTRNMGIEMAAGTYLLFVDSDDLVCADYVASLYRMAEQTGARMTVCGFQPFYEGKERFSLEASHIRTPVRVMTSKEALESLFYKKEITASPCYRLFHREIFDGLRFEKGRIFEDLGLMYLAVEAAGRVAYTPQVMYFYRQREGSTMHQLRFDERRLDRIYFSEKILYFAAHSDPQLMPAARARYFVSCYLVLSELPGGPAYQELYRTLRNNMKQYGRLVVRDVRAPLKTRLMAALACVSIPLTRQAGAFLRRHTSQS